MNLKRPTRVALVVGALFLSRSAAAQDAAQDANVCTDSYENAQTLMKPGQAESKLIPAREALRTCMRSGCKDWMVADCSKWLGEVEGRIPAVVFYAKNTAGRDLTDVKVSRATGEELTTRIDGRAIEMEAGIQTFVFTLPDGTKREKQALIREGDKTQSVSAVFDAPPEELNQGTGGPNLGTDGRPEHKPSTLKYVGYGVGGLGIVGLAVGGIFGLNAISKKNSANCDANGFCDPGPLADASSAADVATVGFIAGGVLLAAGAALVLLAPSSHARGARTWLAPRRAGLGLGGSW